MSTGLGTFVSIILFIIALGVLIAIHELGHLIAAKTFKVYCSDFSIGFGPKILKIKRKKGETTYSLGCIPFGGYVSMAGEDDEDSPMPDLPKSRTLAGISRWKRIIIMLAGIFMNFVLAYILFLIACGCFEQSQLYLNFSFNESQDNAISTLVVDWDVENELSSLDFFNYSTYVFEQDGSSYSVTYILKTSDDSFAYEYNGNYYILALNLNDSELGYYNCDVAEFLVLYQAQLVENVTVTDVLSNTYVTTTYVPIVRNNNLITLDLTTITDEAIVYYPQIIRNSETNTYETYDSTLTLYVNSSTERFYSFGYSLYVYRYYNGASSFSQAGSLWVRSTTLISEAIGDLFVGQGWDEVGGIVAILTQTTSTLMNNPFYVYLQQWGMISVNLALFNLLPFPGLDGWQVLVELIEGSVNLVYKFKRKRDKKKYELAPETTYLKSNVEDTSLIESIPSLAYVATSNDKIVLDDNETKYPNKSPFESNVKTNLNKMELTIGEEMEDEKNKERHLPKRFKSIMSLIGITLLLALMVVILIKDIIGLF